MIKTPYFVPRWLSSPECSLRAYRNHQFQVSLLFAGFDTGEKSTRLLNQRCIYLTINSCNALTAHSVSFVSTTILIETSDEPCAIARTLISLSPSLLNI